MPVLAHDHDSNRSGKVDGLAGLSAGDPDWGAGITSTSVADWATPGSAPLVLKKVTMISVPSKKRRHLPNA